MVEELVSELLLGLVLELADLEHREFVVGWGNRVLVPDESDSPHTAVLVGLLAFSIPLPGLPGPLDLEPHPAAGAAGQNVSDPARALLFRDRVPPGPRCRTDDDRLGRQMLPGLTRVIRAAGVGGGLRSARTETSRSGGYGVDQVTVSATVGRDSSPAAAEGREQPGTVQPRGH